MKTDAQILTDFDKRVGDYFATNNQQRDMIRQAFMYRDGNQWNEKELSERSRLNKKVATINLLAPVIRNISGSECMTDTRHIFIPLSDGFDEKSDAMTHATDFVRHVSNFDSEKSIAVEDTLTCGIGAVATFLDMTKKEFIAGVPVSKRVYPNFVSFDNSLRGSNINKGQWCSYADVVDTEWLDEHIKSEIGEDMDGVSRGGDTASMYILSELRSQNLYKLNLLHQYFWYELDTIYDITNPFDDATKQAILNDNDALNIIGSMSDELQLDWEVAYWSLDTESFNRLKKDIQLVTDLLDIQPIKLETSKRKGKCYYRAEIANGIILSKSRSYRQNGHPLNIMTGYFDEILGIYYGLVRAMSQAQDLINELVSDLRGYTKKLTIGGDVYAQGDVPSLTKMQDLRLHEETITPVPVGTVLTPKAQTNTPDIFIATLNAYMDILPRLGGFTRQFLEADISGNMNDALMARVNKQVHATMYNFVNNYAQFEYNQAEISEALVRKMTAANDGHVIPIVNLTGYEDANKIRLFKKSFADGYSIIPTTRPMSIDERQDAATKLIELLPTMPQLAPLALKYMNLDLKDRKEATQLMTPQAVTPDPLNQGLLQAQIRMTNAQAAKLEADAQEAISTLSRRDEELQSIIDKNNAQAMKTALEAQQPIVLPMGEQPEQGEYQMPPMPQPQSNFQQQAG